MSATAWNDQFSTWAQSPSATEGEKIQHAITAIRKAIDGHASLAPVTKVFVQGSYRNRVNVRLDSDVDIGVVYTGNAFFHEYPAGKTCADFGNIESPFSYSSFKNDVGMALVRYFGAGTVTRGSKAFDIHANSYRVDADVVPLLVHRRYRDNGTYVCGTELRSDERVRIINWPERLYDTTEWPNQHYENGNSKNANTSRTYRGAVRILKKLRNRMDEIGVTAATPIKGYFIECLVWNVPDECFANSTWYEDIADILAHLSTRTSDVRLCGDWTEVSRHKWLFKGDEPKRFQAAAFVAAAQQQIGA